MLLYLLLLPVAWLLQQLLAWPVLESQAVAIVLRTKGAAAPARALATCVLWGFAES